MKIITTTALLAALLSPAVAHADVDVVYIGGTGTTVNAGPKVPAGFVAPFVTEPVHHSTNLGYDGSPVANPQAAVPAAVAAVDASDHPAVVIGVSKGAQVARGAEAVDTRPDTKYVLIADPDGKHGVSRALGISPPRRTPTHDVTEVVAEYDGIGDFPDRPNPLSVINAVAGWATIHPFYGSGGKNDPLTRIGNGRTTVTPNGNGTSTTHTLIPTKHLPMLKPLRDTELTLTHKTVVTDKIEKALKPAVDSGYSRNDKPKTTKPTEKTADSGGDE